MLASVWNSVVGQQAAIERLTRAAQSPVHAYLFVGPAGSTKKEAARAFAALLIAGQDDPAQRDADLVLRGEHPDVKEVARVGAAISKDQADDIVHTASLAPSEGDRKVMILDEFHLLQANAASRLLKTIEEPPPSTTFLILADFVPHDLITISSRCARIDFRLVDEQHVADQLVSEGVDPDTAAEAAAAAGGNLDRARILGADPATGGPPQGVQPRCRTSSTATGPPSCASSTTCSAGSRPPPLRWPPGRPPKWSVVDERIAQLRRARQRQEGPRRPPQARAATAPHRRAAGRADRDRRRLPRRPRRRDGCARPGAAAQAVVHIHEAMEALERNPNEALLLQSLLWSLPVLTD